MTGWHASMVTCSGYHVHCKYVLILGCVCAAVIDKALNARDAILSILNQHLPYAGNAAAARCVPLATQTCHDCAQSDSR